MVDSVSEREIDEELDEEVEADSEDDEDDSNVPEYRMITTWNAQLTKWTFLLCGVVIGILLVKSGII